MSSKKHPSSKGIGIMSGSSLDGIDAILVEFTENSYSIIRVASFDFPKDLKNALSKSADLKLKDFLVLENRYSRFIADRINEHFEEDYEFISVHGHTTHHVPSLGITNQMINGGVVSAITKKKVITDFRAGDITLGGVGTPLVPILEKAFFPDYDYFLNLGGIANLTKASDWSAYDICPCNQLNNYVCRETEEDFDRDSQLALQGSLDPKLYAQLDDYEYYKHSAPKSLDNNWIRDNYFELLDDQSSNCDKLYTINRWVADKILENLAVAKKLLITGGGAYNKQLISFIKSSNKNIEVDIPSNELIEFKEALLMAYIGYLRINNVPNVLSSVTGARLDNIGGAIYNVHGS